MKQFPQWECPILVKFQSRFALQYPCRRTRRFQPSWFCHFRARRTPMPTTATNPARDGNGSAFRSHNRTRPRDPGLPGRASSSRTVTTKDWIARGGLPTPWCGDPWCGDPRTSGFVRWGSARPVDARTSEAATAAGVNPKTAKTVRSARVKPPRHTILEASRRALLHGFVCSNFDLAIANECRPFASQFGK
jgi:hypothetical protein